MKPENFINRNIKTFMASADKSKIPTTSGLQRVCNPANTGLSA